MENNTEREYKQAATAVNFLGLSHRDLSEICFRFKSEMDLLSDSKILVLGGTGFVGRWLLASLMYAQLGGSNAEITVISRKKADDFPEFSKAKKVNWITHDLSAGYNLELEDYTHVINGATPSTKKSGSGDPIYVFNTIVNGSKSILNALKNQVRAPRYINLSSGAVTKLELSEPNVLPEHCPASHIATSAGAYSHGKLISEMLVNQMSQDGAINGINLRMYAFAGPGIALDEHFAAGNFMLNALRGEKIQVQGNPNTQRSYMYPVDLVGVILKSLVTQEIGTNEVGSGEIVTLKSLAELISRLTSNTSVKLGELSNPVSYYFPNNPTQLQDQIQLSEAISRWWNWLNP